MWFAFRRIMNSRIFVVGSANMDLVIDVPALPRFGQTVAGGDLRFIPGGKGANQACAAAKSGGEAHMVAQVGADPFGAVLTESLRSAGVQTGRVGVSERPSGCASIYVLPSGENSIVISPGANGSLDPATALSRLEDLTPRDIVLLQLEIPIETVEAVLRRAKQAGAATVLDPAPARRLSPELLRNVDYLTPNQTEAAILAGCDGESVETLERAEELARQLLRTGAGTVILKLREMGCLAAASGFRDCVAAHAVKAVDTTAAGDVFNGALAAALAGGEPLAGALRWATAAAAISVTRHGAQTSIPTRAEVERFRERGTAV
jgi:ribokinase